MVEFDRDLRTAVIKHGQEAWPEETCGYVIKTGKKSTIFQCKNISPKPTESFLISLSDLKTARSLGEIIGTWHTHPHSSKEPSLADIAFCESSKLNCYIMSIRKRDDGEFVIDGPSVTTPQGREVDYLKRPYITGIFDCYGLVRDYYRREYGIHLTNHQRINLETGEVAYDKFLKYYEDEGFVRVMDDSYQVGDVMLMQLMDKQPNHVAIYIGNNLIMHHNLDRLSKVDIWGGYWQKFTVARLRHKTKC
jgi:proteasome lid subunit RPN8/RPN11